jgi:heme-degrading monooxygenase HmoA
MFVVLFEVQPKREQWDRYLDLAGILGLELIEIRGFIDNERYASERTKGRLLSLSTWENEKALIRWRTHARHHDIQRQGRFEVFEDYRLRVGEALSDSEQKDLTQTRFDLTEIGAATAVTVTEIPSGQDVPPSPPPSHGLVDAELYGAINTDGKRLLLASWRTSEGAGAWLAQQPSGSRQRHIRIIRDYGIHQRDEAPQHYPPVERGSQRARAVAPLRG